MKEKSKHTKTWSILVYRNSVFGIQWKETKHLEEKFFVKILVTKKNEKKKKRKCDSVGNEKLGRRSRGVRRRMI